MPKLWAETVETHRHEVREAIQETTGRLVEEQGLRSVTMSQIAEQTGIGRATLYKYFPDVESILRAWHERQIERHLQQIGEASEASTTDPFDRVAAVLHCYSLIAHEARSHHETEVVALLHGRHDSHSRAEHQLRGILREVLSDAVEKGAVRSDVTPDELTEYCLHALSASNKLRSKSAVRRLVQVTLTGLKAP